MISSKNILTIGPEHTSPKGGVAQCINTYGKTIYTDFNTLANSCEGSSVKKLYIVIVSIIKLFFILLFKQDIKIVHIHTASNNSFKRSSCYARIAHTMGRKVILHIHGGGFKDYYAKEKAFIDGVFAKSDAIITLSDSWKYFFQKEVGFKNTFIVPNIIENPTKKDVAKDGKFHLLYMGHIYKAKGIFDLVEMINDNHQKYSGKLILDIGGGMYEVEVLKAFIKDNNLEDVIHFHGWVSGDKKLELLNLADAYILPSYTEGVPISILEAESYGLPILSTPVGGIPEIVTDGLNGFLFNPGDKVAMKESVNRLLNDEPFRKKMGQVSFDRSKKNIPSAVEVCLNKLYMSLM